MRGSARRTSTRSCSATTMPASPRRTSPPPGAVLRRMTGSGSQPATRSDAGRARGGAPGHQDLEAKRARVLRGPASSRCTHPRSAALPPQGLLPPGGRRQPAGFAGVFGNIAGAYFQRHGDQSDALAMIAAKNHHNGVQNPYAQMRKDLGFAFCRTVGEQPLRRRPAHQRLARSLARRRRGGARRRPPTPRRRSDAPRRRLPGQRPAQDFLPMSKRDVLKFEGAAAAWARALDQAGITLDDPCRWSRLTIASRWPSSSSTRRWA